MAGAPHQIGSMAVVFASYCTHHFFKKNTPSKQNFNAPPPASARRLPPCCCAWKSCSSLPLLPLAGGARFFSLPLSLLLSGRPRAPAVVRRTRSFCRCRGVLACLSGFASSNAWGTHVCFPHTKNSIAASLILISETSLSLGSRNEFWNLAIAAGSF